MNTFARNALDAEFSSFKRALRAGANRDSKAATHLSAMVHHLSGLPRDCLRGDTQAQKLVGEIFLQMELKVSGMQDEYLSGQARKVSQRIKEFYL